MAASKNRVNKLDETVLADLSTSEDEAIASTPPKQRHARKLLTSTSHAVRELITFFLITEVFIASQCIHWVTKSTICNELGLSPPLYLAVTAPQASSCLFLINEFMNIGTLAISPSAS
jgi:hypothetical protein